MVSTRGHKCGAGPLNFKGLQTEVLLEGGVEILPWVHGSKVGVKSSDYLEAVYYE